jgi:hypothetical protein
MLSWLRHRRETAEKIESEAEGLINNLGAGAYSAARLREHEASSDVMAKHWARVARTVARKIGRSASLRAHG